MNFSVDIGGRKAWPVRALPWVSGRDGPRWHLDAIEVARALSVAGIEWFKFAGVRAWRADQSVIEPIVWEDLIGRLQRLRPDLSDHEEWQLRATLTLPADAFVWIDHWSAAYRASPWGPDNILRLLDEPELDPSERRELQDDADARALIPQPQMDPGLAEMVMEGRRLLIPPLVAVQASQNPGSASLHNMAAPEETDSSSKNIQTPHPPSSPQPAVAAAQERLVKRKALVAELQHEWPEIEHHLREASRNGLSAAAHRHDRWAVDAARQWAREHGALRTSGGSLSMTSLASLPCRVHRI